MKVTTMPVGAYQSNCYFVQEGDRLAIIDAGNEGDRIVKAVKDSGANLEYILLTHGHFDHTTAVEEVKTAFPNAKVYIHKSDAKGAGSFMLDLEEAIPDLCTFDQGDVLPFGDLSFRVIATPGHSLGSVCIEIGDSLFTGDTLFYGSCGRTDLAGGSYDQMMLTLRKLAELEGDFKVYPGHERASTLDFERKNNHFMREATSG